jgi:hypothetical protein
MSQVAINNVMTDHEQIVLDDLRGGTRTQVQLLAALNNNPARIKFNFDKLGAILLPLLGRRQIWTRSSGDDRIYGLEKRLGVVPRATSVHRRYDD